MHPAFDNQQVYNLIIALARAVVLLGNCARSERQALLTRALKAEMMLAALRDERDYWRELAKQRAA